MTKMSLKDKKINKVENQHEQKSQDKVTKTVIQCNFSIEKDLRDTFKEIVFQTKGWEPGNLKEAFQEAVTMWIEANKRNERIK